MSVMSRKTTSIKGSLVLVSIRKRFFDFKANLVCGLVAGICIMQLESLEKRLVLSTLDSLCGRSWW